LNVETGKTYRLDYKLRPGGVIKGKVLDGTGRPVSEGDVFYLDGRVSYGVPIENDGTYRVEGLAPGLYKVSVSLSDKGLSKTVSVEAGRETVADFVLK